MCWEMDYHWLAEQKKAEVAKQEQQRSELIEKLLKEAKTAPEKSDETPAQETIPAK